MEGSKDNPVRLDEVVITPGRHVSAACIELISHFEGLRLEAYPDPGTGGAPWTIGYGATFYEDGSKVKPGDKITIERAKQLLAYHLVKFEGKVLEKVKRPLKQHEFDAAVSFCFNAGTSYKTSGGTWRDYEIWKHITSRYFDIGTYWQSCAITAGGRKLNGLVRRRKSEAHLYTTGELKFFP